MAKTYILRALPTDLWKRFKLMSAQEETPMRTTILRLIAEHVAKAGRGKKAA
jgi:hypothetical protein